MTHASILPPIQLHFVLDDLPTSTKSAELDDSQTQALLDAANEGAAQGTVMGVTESLIGLYFAWLVQVGFLPPPTVSTSETVDGEAVLPLPEIASAAGTKALGRATAN